MHTPPPARDRLSEAIAVVERTRTRPGIAGAGGGADTTTMVQTIMLTRIALALEDIAADTDSIERHGITTHPDT